MSESPWKIHIIHSPRRSKTLSVRLVGDHQIEARVPQGLGPERERELVDRLVARLQARISRAERRTDQDLMKRAQELNCRYFEGKLLITSVRYVANQHSRFGSCTPSAATIRLSDRLAGMPDWVRDYVLVHELAHLIEANHSPRFWSLVHRFPRAERAIGYLMAVGMGDEGEDDPDSTAAEVEGE